MKTYKVIVSSITYYKVEIEAENENEAYEIAKYHADGSDFKEVGLGDWEIHNIQEIQEATV